MKVILPMAGRGSRFANVGFSTPKPLIEIGGKPMFAWALKSLEHVQFNEIIFIALREHEEEYGLMEKLKQHCRFDFQVVWLDQVTQGQLCTVLTAADYIQDNDKVLIIPSDTWVESSIGSDIQNKPLSCKGIISVINLPGDQWSFAQTDENDQVIEVAEKTRISDWASTGLYYFDRWEDLKIIAQQMIDKKETTKGEYYVIPAYQKLIDQGELITISKARNMWDMGTPDSKQAFENKLNK